MSRRETNIPSRRPRAINRQVVYNPSKGFNNLVSPSLIDDREFSDSQNIEYDEGGVARKRSGYSSAIAGLTAAKGLGNFVTETYRHICTVDNGTFKYAAAGAFSSDASISFSSSAEIGMTTAVDDLYIWDGVSGGAKWTGAVLSRPGTLPRAKFSIYYQSVHIAAGVLGQPNRLFISATDDPGMFTRSATLLNNSTEVPGATVFTDATPPQANYIDVRKNDGDRITGLARYQDIVLVFKERSVYQFYFDDNGDPVVSLVTGSTGCVGHQTIEAVENDIYFLSREGVRVIGNEPNFFTSIRTNVLSIRIQPTIDSINPQYYEKCKAHYFDNKYFLSVPTTSSTIALTLVYDRRFQSWSKWTNFNATGYIKYVDTSNDEHFYFLSSDGTEIFEFEAGTYNDDGAAIDAFIVSKAFDAKNPDIMKYWVDIGLVFRRLAGQVDITVYTDGGALLGTGTISQGSVDGMGLLPLGQQGLGFGTMETSEDTLFSDEPQRVVVNTNSRTVKFKIQNDRLNENFVFLGYILAYFPFTHYVFDSSRKIYL
jgi:hypothetical protein